MQTKITSPVYSALLILFFSGSILISSTLSAKEPARIIAGWVEKVQLEDQEFDVKAKLDTGARTSSINARDIKSFEKDGEPWVKYTLILVDSKNNNHEIEMEKLQSRQTMIKNHDGEHDKRYVVNLEVCFNGRKIPTEFTLADRREYIYDVLLGRQFLKNNAIVDPKNIFLTTTNCE